MLGLREKFIEANQIVTETQLMFKLKWIYISSLNDDAKASEMKLTALRKQESRVELLIKNYKTH